MQNADLKHKLVVLPGKLPEFAKLIQDITGPA